MTDRQFFERNAPVRDQGQIVVENNKVVISFLYVCMVITNQS